MPRTTGILWQFVVMQINKNSVTHPSSKKHGHIFDAEIQPGKTPTGDEIQDSLSLS